MAVVRLSNCTLNATGVLTSSMAHSKGSWRSDRISCMMMSSMARYSSGPNSIVDADRAAQNEVAVERETEG